jgi:hypothetical protein
MRTEAIDFREFVNNDWRPFSLSEVRRKGLRLYQVGSGIFLVLAPQVASAQAEKSEATFNEVFLTALNILDWICVGCLMFTGVSWMMGNRTGAIERLLLTCSGYLLARHSVEIKDWLKGL